MIEGLPVTPAETEANSIQEALLLSPDVQRWVLDLRPSPEVSSIEEIMDQQQWSATQKEVGLKYAQLIIAFSATEKTEAINWWKNADKSLVEAKLRPLAPRLYTLLVASFNLKDQPIESLDLSLVTPKAT